MPRKLTTEEFIIKARKVHGNKYDYSSVHYVNYPRLKHVGFLLRRQKIATNAMDSPKSFQ